MFLKATFFLAKSIIENLYFLTPLLPFKFWNLHKGKTINQKKLDVKTLP